MPKMSTVEVRSAVRSIAEKHDIYLGRIWTDEPTVLRGKGTPNRVVGWQVMSKVEADLLAVELNKVAAAKGCEVNARVTGGGDNAASDARSWEYDYVRCNAVLVK